MLSIDDKLRPGGGWRLCHTAEHSIIFVLHVQAKRKTF
jgi:hypothetical protein